ncbi:hypothetical protein KVV02_004469 [Mortierella alpina]|uniref:Uncharacterized protein n=1 Tax=Mortierella alpina TaxID=64518 RepID=A0A9P8A065_MORAP|nr:hypothetical protein KVV02_004469 [Mortierella alpina]
MSNAASFDDSELEHQTEDDDDASDNDSSSSGLSGSQSTESTACAGEEDGTDAMDSDRDDNDDDDNDDIDTEAEEGALESAPAPAHMAKAQPAINASKARYITVIRELERFAPIGQDLKNGLSEAAIAYHSELVTMTEAEEADLEGYGDNAIIQFFHLNGTRPQNKRWSYFPRPHLDDRELSLKNDTLMKALRYRSSPVSGAMTSLFGQDKELVFRLFFANTAQQDNRSTTLNRTRAG